MPTPIIIPILDDSEKWLRENINDLPTDSVCSVLPQDNISFDGKTIWADSEDGSKKTLEMTDYIKGLNLLFNQIGRSLFVGGLKSPHDLIDPCNWDPEVTDSFFQLCYHGEVIYG